MKKLFVAAAVTAAMIIAPAQAVVVDFANEADTHGERGVPSGATITIDGVHLRLTGFQNVPSGGFSGNPASPYFDAGNAGLGVCKVLTMTNQCNPSNDDNVTANEAVSVEFRDATFTSFVPKNIEGLVFRDANHNLINLGNNGMLRIVTTYSDFSLGDMTALFTTFMDMASMGDAFFRDLISIAFLHDDKQFYLSAMDVKPVPIPGAFALLLSGIAGLGFASRRRKKAA